MPDPQKPTIDERIEAIVHTAELLLKQGEDTDKRIAELAEASQRHELASQRQEREIQRFRRAMRAALEAWISEDEPGESQK
jgi:hypothetical protein